MGGSIRARDFTRLRRWQYQRAVEPEVGWDIAPGRDRTVAVTATYQTELVDLRQLDSPEFVQRYGYRELEEMRRELHRRMAAENDRQFRHMFFGEFQPDYESPEERRAREEERQRAREAENQRRAEAQERGLKLLRENLTKKQLTEYNKHQYFHVTGGDTGTVYRILHGRQINIRVLAKGPKSEIVSKLCFLPAGDLVEGDVMLAQKHALELQETHALKIANRYPPDNPAPNPLMWHRFDHVVRRNTLFGPVDLS